MTLFKYFKQSEWPCRGELENTPITRWALGVFSTILQFSWTENFANDHICEIFGPRKFLAIRYKKQTDRLQASGVGVNSDDDLDEVDIYFIWYVEIHGVISRRAAVNPPTLLESSEIDSSSQHVPTPVSAPSVLPNNTQA